MPTYNSNFLYCFLTHDDALQSISRLSVCPSVTVVYHNHIVLNFLKIITQKCSIHYILPYWVAKKQGNNPKIQVE